MSTSPVLTVLSVESSFADDQALCRFARFLGLRTELLALSGDLAEPPAALLTPRPGAQVLALGRTALRRIYERDWFARLLAGTSFMFVYGFTPTKGESPELKWLTAGALSSVTDVGAGSKVVAVAPDVKLEDFSVLGRSYSSASGPTAAFSAAPPASGFETYISVNGHPHFVCLSRGQSVLFLLAESELVDIDKVLSPELSLRPWYAQFISLTVFLRRAFGDWCWTAPVTGATIVVDDPYLKRRYGYVHYETLVRALERARGALTVAFIPYNYRRSDQRTVDLLRRYSNRFSIALHGCDHTGGEFASADEARLEGAVFCALGHMESHRDMTRMPFDNVMIFPHGLFSTKAIYALKACGIDAAVNSTPWPVDYRENPLTIRDLLEVAITRYGGFPVFVRRYPRDLFDYAFDAMLQKPVLVVEHHRFFRRGHKALVELVRGISTLSPKVAWTPLGRTVTTSCLLKRKGENLFTLRHFTPVIRLKNPSPSNLALSIEKPEQDGHVEAVLVGNRKVPFEIHSGFLTYEARVAAGEELSATVVYRTTPRARRSLSRKHRFIASARRLLSDFRDNHLSRSERVLLFISKVRQILTIRERRGGGSRRDND